MLICLITLGLACASCVSDPAANGKGAAGKVKNIIILIGDGMGPVHEDAGRNAKGAPLVWDGFEYHAMVYTGSLTTIYAYSPTDSAASATAIATGEKTANGLIGMDVFERIEYDNIMKIAKDKGRATGVVTSDRLSGATPASFSAHAGSRNREEDIVLAQARSGVDLLMGANSAVLSEYIGEFTERGYVPYETLYEAEQTGGRVIGLFPAVTPTGGETGETLQNMTVFALEYLSRSRTGFVLMIEGAKIDQGSSEMNLDFMLSEFAAFEECARIVSDWAKENGETMVIVTADHETGGLAFSDDGYLFTSGGNHTNTEVNCHITWPFEYSPFDAYLKDGRIDNTDLFRIMYSAIQ